MNVIQTGFLFGLLAVAIPVLVHLLSRWQVRRVELGTMRFLQEVIQDGRQKRKIRRWLLMLTRMATVALLALLFARPYFPTSIRRDGDRLRLILIDRSASMSMPGQGGRLIDDAVATASDVAAELGRDATVIWAWFDSQVQPFDASVNRITAPRSVVGDTNYLAALSWARDRAAADADSIADVVLLTDLQQSGIAADVLETAALAMPKSLPIRVIDVGRAAANNLAIQSIEMPAKRISPDRSAVAQVTLFNFGTLPMEEVPLTATAKSDRRSVRLKKSINLPGGQAQELAFDFGNLESGLWKITAQLDVEDDLAVDNRRMTAVEIAQPAPVLIIDGGTAQATGLSESFYLEAALRQSTRSPLQSRQDDKEKEKPKGLFNPSIVYLYDDQLPVLNPSKTALVVVTDSGAPSASAIQRLGQYVQSGGHLLVFAGDGDSGSVQANHDVWQQTGLAPGELSSPRRSVAMPFHIEQSNTSSSMLLPFDDPQQGDLGRLAFDKILPVEPADSTDVLARFEQQFPALTRHQVEQGRVVWFLSSADDSWGNWPTSPLYLPLVHQMAADLLSLTGEGRIRYRSVGDQRQNRLGLAESPTVAVSDITNVSMRESDVADFTFDRPGFQTDGDALYVVNSAAKESDPNRIAMDKFAEHFQITLADGDQEQAAESVQAEHKDEIWPWLALAAIVLLTGEFTLANRTSA